MISDNIVLCLWENLFDSYIILIIFNYGQETEILVIDTTYPTIHFLNLIFQMTYLNA